MNINTNYNYPNKPAFGMVKMNKSTGMKFAEMLPDKSLEGLKDVIIRNKNPEYPHLKINIGKDDIVSMYFEETSKAKTLSQDTIDSLVRDKDTLFNYTLEGFFRKAETEIVVIMEKTKKIGDWLGGFTD